MHEQSMMDQYIQTYGCRLYGLCVTLCAGYAGRSGNNGFSQNGFLDAEDLYQETWLRAYKNFHQYDGSRPFEGWITAICVNVYRDSLRRKKISTLFDKFRTAEEKDAMLESVPASEKKDYTALHEAIGRLPEKLRITVILFYFHDMKESQVAESLGIPPGTVKSRLNNARKILRKELSDEEHL